MIKEGVIQVTPFACLLAWLCSCCCAYACFLSLVGIFVFCNLSVFTSVDRFQCLYGCSHRSGCVMSAPGLLHQYGITLALVIVRGCCEEQLYQQMKRFQIFGQLPFPTDDSWAMFFFTW
jgi:hypothetical protein